MAPKIKIAFLVLGLSLLLLLQEAVSVDYGSALTKSLLYFEAQRSGKLPSNQRVSWRGDSALKDGSDVRVDLVGGYYDAGDNVKFGFPQAFTVTMLSWSVIDFGSKLSAKNELGNALAAIKWGTDYFIKAHPQANVLYGQVGDGDADHACWQRPEDMNTPRTSYKIDEKKPGSDLAGETAAAFAAASMAFRKSDPDYSSKILDHAKQLFDFANSHQGTYQSSIPQAHFYSSSGFQDELVWAAAWLFRATNDKTYSDYLNDADTTGGPRTMFSWDDKYAGAQILIGKLVWEGKASNDGFLGGFKDDGEQFICNLVQKGDNNAKRTNAGALWWDSFNNLQYTTTALFLTLSYADSLSSAKATLDCLFDDVSPNDLVSFARSQVDYILGKNPKGMSYMVGFGSSFPQKVHHRGASIVSIKKNNKHVTCQEGLDVWFNSQSPNPNVLEGAIVGGPDQGDNYIDSRSNFQQAEAATANSGPIVGVLARLA